jgi:hypothetical protein
VILLNGIAISASRGKQVYDLQELIFDSMEDFANLPTDIAPGSTAFCVAESKSFMLNTKKVWVELK